MKTKTLIRICVALIILTLLAGCAPARQDGEQQPADDAAATDPAAPGDGDGVRRFTIFISDPAAKKAPLDSPVHSQIRELYGVEFEWIIPATEPNERLSIMLAADVRDLPDLIAFGDEPIMRQYIEAGRLLRKNDYLEQYAPNVVNINFKEFYDRIKTKDGGVYFLPIWYTVNASEYNFPENTCSIWMKSRFFDETDNWDLVPPETLEDVTNILRLVKEHYPDQAPMSLALGARGRLGDVIHFGAGAYGLFESGHVVLNDDGSLSYIMENEKMKEYFRWLNRLNQEGLLDIESPLLSVDTLREKIIGEKAFSSIVWGLGTLRNRYVDYHQSKGVMDRVMFFNFPKGDESVTQKTFARRPVNVYTTGLSATVNMQNPEEFFRFYSEVNTERGHFNVLGITNWEFEGENTVEATEGYNFIAYKDPLPDGRRRMDWSAWNWHMWDQDPEWAWQFGVENMIEFTFNRESNVPDSEFDILIGLGEVDAGYTKTKEYLVNKHIGWEAGMDYWNQHRNQWVDTSPIAGLLLTDDDVAVKASLDIVLERKLPRVIMTTSDQAFEQEWTTMMSELRRVGLDRYMAAVRKAYDERMEIWNAE